MNDYAVPLGAVRCFGVSVRTAPAQLTPPQNQVKLLVYLLRRWKHHIHLTRASAVASRVDVALPETQSSQEFHLWDVLAAGASAPPALRGEPTRSGPEATGARPRVASYFRLWR